jgi:1,2-diacylglycerol 3-beta-glucosyltransferase
VLAGVLERLVGRAVSVVAGWGRLRARLATAQEPAIRAGLVVPPEDCVVYYLIPCRNAGLVIGDTVRSLLADSRGLVVVVDDASDDRTGELAAAAGGDRAVVVRRERPDARRGQGPALNAGFAQVLRDAGVRAIAASRITVCVMDPDGRLSAGALDGVLALFEDPQVGGVQLPARIRNRDSLLTVMQDLEVRGACAIAQLGAMACGTVTQGGNGQFTRLASLLEVGPAPWPAQLAEGRDLSLALAARGWRVACAPDACVSQPGVTSLRALVGQRTRWYTGRVQAVAWLRELWSSRQLSRLARIKLATCLLVRWALVLPWSVIFSCNLLIMVTCAAGWRGAYRLVTGAHGGARTRGMDEGQAAPVPASPVLPAGPRWRAHAGAAAGRGTAAGEGRLRRDRPARPPGSRSGHGQPRRVAGSHRATRRRPAQHSGR